MPPYRSAVCSYIARTLFSSATSTSTGNASLASDAVCSAASASTSATQTRAPSSEKRSAASRPIPPPAPVMTATLPSRRPISGSPRDEHVLDLGVPVERVHPELAAEPGLLEPTERRRRPDGRVRVDREDAGVQRARDAERPAAVLRPDRAREAVRGVVGDPDRVLLVGKRDHGGHRA